MTQKRGLTEREAAAYTGFSLTAFKENRLYGPRKGHLPPPPHVKLGRSIRYLRDDLDRWLELHRSHECEKLSEAEDEGGCAYSRERG